MLKNYHLLIATILIQVILISSLYLLFLTAGVPDDERTSLPVFNTRAINMKTSETLSDWTITSGEAVIKTDTTIELSGNLTIHSGASLTLEHVVLIMNSTANVTCSIVVEPGGLLTIIVSTVTAQNTSCPYFFRIYGEVDIKNSEISYIGTDTTVYPPRGGVEIYSSDVTISGSRIRYGGYIGIYIEECSPRVTLNDISLNCGYGIFCNGGSGQIIKNNITGNGDDGIYVKDADKKMVIENNFISGNDGNGIYLENSCPSITNNLIQGNNRSGIEGIGNPLNDIGFVKASRNVIESNNNWGIYTRNLNVVEDNNSIDDNGIGLRLYEWDVLIEVVNPEGNVLRNVDTVITDADKKSVWEGKVNVGGTTEYITLVELKELSDGQTVEPNPYKIEVCKDEDENSTMVIVNDTMKIRITLGESFPEEDAVRGKTPLWQDLVCRFWPILLIIVILVAWTLLRTKRKRAKKGKGKVEKKPKAEKKQVEKPRTEVRGVAEEKETHEPPRRLQDLDERVKEKEAKVTKGPRKIDWEPPVYVRKKETDRGRHDYEVTENAWHWEKP